MSIVFCKTILFFLPGFSVPTAYGFGLAAAAALAQFIVVLGEGIAAAGELAAGQGVDLDIVDGSEDALLDVGVGFPELTDKLLHLLALAPARAILRRIPLLREAAGALEEAKAVVVLPGDDILLMDAVKGADELHPREILAVELGGHGLHLGAVEKPQKGGLDDVREVVAQGDLVAAQLLRLGVEKAPAHPGAEVAGVPVHGDGDIEDVALKDGDGDVELGGVFFNKGPVFGVVAGIHHQEHQLEGLLRVAMELLHELCQQHGVLSAGDTHRDAVAGGDEFIALYRRNEGVPEGLAVLLDQAALHHGAGVQFS